MLLIKHLLLYQEDPASYQEYITFSYSNLSVLYNQLNDYDNALQYGLKAANEFKSSGTWTQGYIFNNNYNLAGIYLDSKQFEKPYSISGKPEHAYEYYTPERSDR